MDYNKKDLEYLQEFKLKNTLDDVPIVFNYLYIYQNEVIFINHFRKKYRVLCSPQCHEAILFDGRQFDVVYENESLEQTKIEFHKYVFRSIRKHSGW